jgi:adenylosuccinate synthase
VGIRAGDLLDKDMFRNRLRAALEFKNTVLTKAYEVSPLSLEEIYDQYCRYGQQLAPLIRDTTSTVREAVTTGRSVLLEGAQGALLDPDFGTYPYVTSSSPLAGAGCIGAGLGPREINRVMGVFKAYNSRVGAGPMPTELKDEVGNFIREKAREYVSDIALTHLDIYDGFPSIRVCTAYRFNDEVLTSFPSDAAVLEECQPVYEELHGWQQSIGETRDFDRLPTEARDYMSRLEDLLSCPIGLVSVGPDRKQIVPVKWISPWE